MEQNKILKATDYQFYGYINTVVSEVYKDMSAAVPFPDQYREDLHKYIFRDDFLDTALPAVYTYFPCGKPGGTPMAVFGKCARKTNAVSVCRYTQVAGWAWSEGELYRDSFESMLDFGFYSEAEVDALAAGRSAAPYGSSRGGLLSPLAVEIHPSALKVLVYAAYLIWQRSDPLVRIAVPSQYTGDAYNAYVLGAVRNLYSYFPVGLRTKAGFTSYLPEGKEKNLNNLYFAFVPQAEAGPNAVYLDGSSLPVYERMSTSFMLPGLDAFIEHMLKIKDPTQRAQFIAKVFADVDGGEKIRDLFPLQYTYIGDTLLLLNHSGTALDTIPQWINFCNHPEKFPASLHQEIRSSIQRELTPGIFAEYLEEQYPNTMTLQAFGDKYAHVSNIACVTEGLRACFWTRLKEIIAANRVAPADALAFLQNHSKGLKKLDSAEFDQLCSSYRKKLGEDVLKAAYAKVDSAALSCGTIRETAAQAAAQAGKALASAYQEEEIAALQEYINARGSQRVVTALRKQFQPVALMPIDTTEQIRSVISAAEGLKAELEQEIVPDAEAFRQELSAFIAEKNSLLGDYGILCNKINSELMAMTDYFQAIAHVSQAMREHSTFEASDRQQFLSLTVPLRAREETAYKEAFQAYCSKPLTMENLHTCDPLVVSCVLEDLAGFFRKPYVLKKSSAQKMYNAILRRQAVLEQFCTGQKLTVSLDQTLVDAELLKQILMTDCGSLRQENGETVKKLALGLAEANVYSGKQMAPLCEMFIRCELKFSPLLEKACDGAFRDAEEEDYLALFEVAYQALKEKKRNPLEQMSQSINRKDGNDTAQRAFRRFRKAHESKPKSKIHPGWITSIVLGLAVALLVGGTVWLALSLNTKKDTIAKLEAASEGQSKAIQEKDSKLQANQDTITGLEDEQARRTDLSFLDAEPAEFTAAIRSVAALEESNPDYQVYNSRYRTYNKDFVVIRAGGKDIAWSEYFLWECYFASKEKVVAADTFLAEALQSNVQSTLMLVHGKLEMLEALNSDTPEALLAKITPTDQNLKADVETLAAAFEEILAADEGGYILPTPETIPTEPEETEAATPAEPAEAAPAADENAVSSANAADASEAAPEGITSGMSKKTG